jgi:hypothetical protein
MLLRRRTGTRCQALACNHMDDGKLPSNTCFLEHGGAATANIMSQQGCSGVGCPSCGSPGTSGLRFTNAKHSGLVTKTSLACMVWGPKEYCRSTWARG